MHVLYLPDRVVGPVGIGGERDQPAPPTVR